RGTLQPQLGAPGRRVLTRGGSPARGLGAQLCRRLLERPHGPDADVLVLAEREPVGERPRRHDRRELRRERLLVLVALACGELRAAGELAEAGEEARLERGEREEAAVGAAVDAVAGEATREQPRPRVAAEPEGDEVVRPVCHRDDEPRAA